MIDQKFCRKCKKFQDEWYPSSTYWCAKCHRNSASSRRKLTIDRDAKVRKKRWKRLTLLGKCYTHPNRQAKIPSGRCEECYGKSLDLAYKRRYGISWAAAQDLKKIKKWM